LGGKKRMIYGVSLVCEREVDGKILIVQETQEKAWKKPGDFSIPMETKEGNETLEKTIIRAIEEEAKGIILYQIKGTIGQKDYDIIGLALVKCYVLTIKEYKDPLTGKEVKNHQWMSPEEALHLKLRVGAKEMIEDFLNPSSLIPYKRDEANLFL